MQIDIDLLYTWGAIAKKYSKNDLIFNEDDPALFYYQIIEGSVRMYHSYENGRELNQGIFCKGESFGEPPIFVNGTYPSSAIAMENSIILKLNSEKFLKILEDYPRILMGFLQLISQRIHDKTMRNKQIINQCPETRINSFLAHYKEEHQLNNKEKIYIPFTRQQIADFTALRVETVIRCLKEMAKENKINIEQHKIYF